LVSLDPLLRGSRVVCGGIGHHNVFLQAIKGMSMIDLPEA
jgi:hypothetical protein